MLHYFRRKKSNSQSTANCLSWLSCLCDHIDGSNYLRVCFSYKHSWCLRQHKWNLNHMNWDRTVYPLQTCLMLMCMLQHILFFQSLYSKLSKFYGGRRQHETFRDNFRRRMCRNKECLFNGMSDCSKVWRKSAGKGGLECAYIIGFIISVPLPWFCW